MAKPSRISKKSQHLTSPKPPFVLPELQVEHHPVRTLKPYSRNPRTHSKKQIQQIADSIKEFSFTNPVLIDGKGGIPAGHGRVEAAKLLGMETVPTLRVEGLTEAQIRAYILADNRLAENAGWDRELLALELQYLTNIEVDFDVSITGFETAEIDLLIEDLEPPRTTPRQMPSQNVNPMHRRSVGPETCGISDPTDFSALTPGTELRSSG